MTDWNFADAFEAIAAKVPDAPAQMCGERLMTWGEWDRRANALAADLLQAGLGRQSKVAAYLYNGVEYLEVYLGAWKAGMVPVHTNYRYGPDELVYLFDNADAEAVVFHTSFGPLLDRIRGKLPQVRRWYAIVDGLPIPDWAVAYEERVAAGTDRIAGPWGRSGDDLLMLYTGGTTGMPKGVMWRQDDLFNVLGGGGNPIIGVPPASDYDDLAGRLTGPGARMLPACPLMHGTGQFSAFITLNGGGCVVTMPERNFNAATLWQTVQDKQINAVVIVGDAFAKPMLAALD